jgi:hypothetical protein
MKPVERERSCVAVLAGLLLLALIFGALVWLFAAMLIEAAGLFLDVALPWGPAMVYGVICSTIVNVSMFIHFVRWKGARTQ